MVRETNPGDCSLAPCSAEAAYTSERPDCDLKGQREKKGAGKKSREESAICNSENARLGGEECPRYS